MPTVRLQLCGEKERGEGEMLIKRESKKKRKKLRREEEN